MAAEQIPGQAPADCLASLLEDRRADIIANYERLLRQRGNWLVLDPAAHQQVLAHGEQIVQDVVDSLRASQVVVNKSSRTSLAHQIGAARAGQYVHPAESLQASVELFTAVMRATLYDPQATEDSPLLLASMALHQCIIARISDAATTYAGFLINQIYRAQVDERRLLARELHDRVGTHLSIAQRQLELCEMTQEKEPAEAAQHVATAHEALVGAMRDIRDLNANLRLTEPVESLLTALRDFLSSVAPNGVATEVVVNGDESWVPPTALDEIFLVIREALRNALTHGAPDNVLVRVNIAPHELWATVEDDGTGFSPELSTAAADGTGLPSMRERVALLGGELTLASSPGNGTRVILLIPLQGNRNARPQ